MEDAQNRILPAAAVSKRLGISRTTLWRLIKAGDFPQAIKLSPNRVGWRESQITAWIETR